MENQLQNFINVKAPTLASVYDNDIGTSTEVAIVSGATYLEVSAIAQGVFLKWGATASSSDFDEYISPGTTRYYVIPVGTETVEFIEAEADAILVVIQK